MSVPIKETEKKMQEISDTLDKLNGLLDEAYFFSDGVYNELSEGLDVPTKKKQREAFLKKKAVERFPEIVRQVEQLDVALQGVGLYIDEAKETLQSKMDALEEIAELQDELEQRKQELDL